MSVHCLIPWFSFVCLSVSVCWSGCAYMFVYVRVRTPVRIAQNVGCKIDHTCPSEYVPCLPTVVRLLRRHPVSPSPDSSWMSSSVPLIDGAGGREWGIPHRALHRLDFSRWTWYWSTFERVLCWMAETTLTHTQGVVSSRLAELSLGCPLTYTQVRVHSQLASYTKAKKSYVCTVW